MCACCCLHEQIWSRIWTESGIRNQNLCFKWFLEQWSSVFLSLCISDWNISCTIPLNIVVKFSHALQKSWQTEQQEHCVEKSLVDSDSRGRLPSFSWVSEVQQSSLGASCKWHFTGNSPFLTSTSAGISAEIYHGFRSSFTQLLAVSPADMLWISCGIIWTKNWQQYLWTHPWFINVHQAAAQCLPYDIVLSFIASPSLVDFKGLCKNPIIPWYLQVEQGMHKAGSMAGEENSASRACPVASTQTCHVLIPFPAASEASKEISKIINRIQSTCGKCPKEKWAVPHWLMQHTWRQHRPFL